MPVPSTRKLLVTAGPTHEPIDSVRYIANRSSGRVGIAIAEAAAARGMVTTLLLGPTPRAPDDSRVKVLRFQSTAELQALLQMHFPSCDLLIMAAAVADFRPRRPAGASDKLRRADTGLTLELEPTPDLLAGVARAKRESQVVVGFALEPRDRLMESALSKLDRKNLDYIVANPLETMDAEAISATLIAKGGERWSFPSDGTAFATKQSFAAWLLDRIGPERST